MLRQNKLVHCIFINWLTQVPIKPIGSWNNEQAIFLYEIHVTSAVRMGENSINNKKIHIKVDVLKLYQKVKSAKVIAEKRKQPLSGHLLMLSLCGRVIERVREVTNRWAAEWLQLFRK